MISNYRPSKGYLLWTLFHIHAIAQQTFHVFLSAHPFYHSYWHDITVSEVYLQVPNLQVSWRDLGGETGGCFTNVSRALQRNLTKIHNAKNPIYVENFKLKLCTCVQSMALGTRTKFQLEILIRSTNFAIHKFREKILESLRNVSETTPWTTLQGTWIVAPEMAVGQYAP